MARYGCIIHEGQTPESRKSELAAGLAQIGAEMFGDPEGDAEVTWVTIREGFGFTAGGPSTSSLVVRSVPPELSDEEREAFLSKVCDLWQEVTGCTKDEIVATAMDGPLPL
jgi:phenylpyruvate tautomerase PptA (4-oxalocrotonate tautomerase family)